MTILNFHTRLIRTGGLLVAMAVILSGLAGGALADEAARWRNAWPDTDFAKHTVPLSEVMSGGVPKDGIPALDAPEFMPVGDVDELADTEPVVALEIGGEARAYPLRILMWHEIVNDTLGGVPVAVTYCPLCNTAIVFDRRVAGAVLDFGTTGNLRHSDLVMYDRQTESWWQQYGGEGIVGDYAGTTLTALPSRLTAWRNFRERHPDGEVLAEPDFSRSYGRNPYAGYDERPVPYFDVPDTPPGVAPLDRVVAVGDQAWMLDRLREATRIETERYVLTWTPGQNTALGAPRIAEGRDVGNVVVQEKTEEGLKDAVYVVTFAFAFNAFAPDGTLHR